MKLFRRVSIGWYECENSYEPFVKYYLGIILKAYNELRAVSDT